MSATLEPSTCDRSTSSQSSLFYRFIERIIMPVVNITRRLPAKTLSNDIDSLNGLDILKPILNRALGHIVRSSNLI